MQSFTTYNDQFFIVQINLNKKLMELAQKISNPEDKFSLQNTDKSNNQTISLSVLQTIQEHLALKQYQKAKQAAKENIFLLRTVNSHLLLEAITKILEQSSDQAIELEQQMQLSQRQEKLFNAVKRMKNNKSLNKSLVREISTVVKELAYANDTCWLDKALKSTVILSDQIYKPLKDLWVKLSGKMSDNQIEFKLRQWYEECEQLKLQVTSFKNQLQLTQKQLKCKIQQIAKMKQKEKRSIYNQIKQKDRINKQNKLLRQECGKYMDKLQQVYTNSTPHQEQNETTPQNDDSLINKLVAKMKQSISLHRSSFKTMLENHQSQVESLKREYESKIQKLNTNIVTASKEQIQKLKGQKSELQLIIQNKKQIIKQLQDSKVLLEKKLAEKTKNETQIQAKIAQQTKQLKDSIQTLQRKLKNKSEEVLAERQCNEATKMGLQEKDMLIQMNKQTLRNKEEEITNLEEQLAAAKSKCNGLEKKIQQITLSQKQQVKRKNLEQQYKENSKIQEKFEQQLQEMKGEKAELQLKLQELKIVRNKEKQEFQASIKRIQQANSKSTSIQKILESHKTKLQESQEKLKEANSKIMFLTAEAQFKKIYPEEKVDGLFANELLHSQPQHKLFLRKVLEQRYKSKIYSTNLIYKTDPLNKINFHQYIDNKECLLVIVKLINGNIVAGYTQGKVYPKMVADKDGLIISVTNRELFQPIENNKKTVFHDDYFFILGNSEFRVKTGQLKFFSNFAVSNGYYKNRGMKINTLTGTNGRQLEMTNIQFYQIVFY